MAGGGAVDTRRHRRGRAAVGLLGAAALVAASALIGFPARLEANGPGREPAPDTETPSIGEAAARLAREGRISAARAAYEARLELLEAAIPSAGDDVRRTTIATLHEKIGLLLESEGRNRDALRHYDELVAIRAALAEADPDDPRRQARLAWAHMMLGNMLQATGRPEEARGHLARSVAMLAPWGTDDAAPGSRRDYAVVLGELAELDGEFGDHDEAARRFSQAETILRSLLRRDPFADHLQEDLARLLFFRSGEQSVRGESDGALAALRESRSLRLALLHRAPDDLERRARLAVTIGRLAVERRDRGEAKAAVMAYRAAIEHLEPVVVARLDDLPHRRQLMRDLIGLADCLADEGDTTERGILYLRALGLADRLLAADPADPSRRQDRAVAGRKLGLFEEEGARYDAAWRAYDGARRIIEDLAEEAPDRRDRQDQLKSIYNDLGDAWLGLKAPAEARRFYQKAYDITERLTDGGTGYDYRADFAHYLRKLALVDEAVGDVSGALERLKRARILLRFEAETRPDNAWVTRETKLVVDAIARLSGGAKP